MNQSTETSQTPHQSSRIKNVKNSDVEKNSVNGNRSFTNELQVVQ